MKSRDLARVGIDLIFLAICVFLFISCASFDIADAPSRYVFPNNQPPVNVFGKVGAFCAYYCLYYLGPGIYIVLASLSIFLFTNLIGKKTNQIVLRFIGMLLLAIVVSCSAYLLCRFGSNSFPMGNGGILGIGGSYFLLRDFGILGRALILVGAAIVGAVLLADTLVIALLRALGGFFYKLMFGAKPAAEAVKIVAEEKKEVTRSWISKIFKSSPKEDKKAATKGGETYDAIEVESEDEEKAQRKKFTISSKKQKLEPVQLHPDIDPVDAIQSIPDEDAPGVISVEEKNKEIEDIKDPDVSKKSSGTEDESQQESETPKRAPVKVTKRKQPKPKKYVQPTYDDYKLPPLKLLDDPVGNYAKVQEEMVRDKAKVLQQTLDDFKVNATVINAEPGPAITMYEIELAAGIKVSQINGLANDIARSMAVSVVRVVAPIPGRDTIGIEVPNSEREIVRIKDLINRAGSLPGKMRIPIFLGKDSSGSALVADLAAMPHGLIAGTTGSGKSVCINTIITSIMLTRRPDEVKLVLIDPKQVEMAPYENIPHLMCPIVTEMTKAAKILEWAVNKMDERYILLKEAGVRQISEFNKLTTEQLYKRFGAVTPEEQLRVPKKMPSIVIIVDELSDLMMTAAKEVEAYIVRIAQKSRAVGIHVILATQRPQATVVTGLIKSNLPARISFQVASRMDSRIILDKTGAETLLGKGDMLYLKPGTSELVRAQGAYLDDEEINGVVDYLKNTAQPDYHPELMQMNSVSTDGFEEDELFDEAVRIVLDTRRGSVSLLQRKLAIGYGRASRMIEMMEQAGIIGEHKNAQAREVLLTLDEWDALRNGDEQGQSGGYEEDFDYGDDYDSPIEEIPDRD
ncbi:MAG: DNA translocase FtsK 4TM domain-containing protein [Sedimentisphaeraceae bacterium JB056]